MQFLELAILICIPLIGSFFLLFIDGDEHRVKENSFFVGILISVSTFIFSVYLCGKIYFSNDEFNSFSIYFFNSFNISLKFGFNLLTSIFMNIICFITILSIFLSRKSIKNHIREYIFLTLLLNFFLLCSVCSREFFLFVISFFCISFILFFQISFWGIEKRANTANKFIAYSLLGNACLFVACLVIYRYLGTSDYEILKSAVLPKTARNLLLILFVGAAFFFFPIFPLHLGLMDCFTEAPSPTRILISGCYTKLMLYFFIQMGIPLMGEDFVSSSYIMIVFLCGSIFLASILSLKNRDIRKFTGYLHLIQNTIVLIGFFCLTVESLKGCLFFAVSQSISMSVFLISMGAYYEKFGYSFSKTNLLKRVPVLSSLIFLSGLNLLGFPPLPNFLGQFLILQSCFKVHPIVAFILFISVIILFVSFYKIFAPVLLGNDKSDEEYENDLNLYEKIISLVIIGGMFFITIHPDFFICRISRVVVSLFE